MKKTTLLLSLLSALALPAFAEDAKPAAAGEGAHRAMMSPEERVKEMKEKLNLTDEQVTKVKAVLEKSQAKMKDLRADTTATEEDKRTKYREAMKASMEEIAPILTPEQQTKWREQMAAHRGGAGGAGAGKKPQ